MILRPIFAKEFQHQISLSSWSKKLFGFPPPPGTKMWAVAPKKPTTVNWLVVSTHLKNIGQIGNLPQIGVKMKNIWNHHLVKLFLWILINPTDESSKLYGNLIHGKHFLKLSMHHRSRVPEPIGGSTKVATGSDGTECQFATSMERTNSNSVKAANLESFLLHLTSSTVRVPQIIGNDGFYSRLYLFHRWTWLKRHLDHFQAANRKILKRLWATCKNHPVHFTWRLAKNNCPSDQYDNPISSQQIDPVKCWKSAIESFSSMDHYVLFRWSS